MESRKKGIIREWVESIVVAAAIAIFLRTFFFQIYKIPTTSMVPTLKPGDKIFVSKLVYGPKIPFTGLRIPGWREPVHDEVIVFIPPHDRKKAYIKRLIGIPGDTIEIRDGNIYRNGNLVTDATVARNFYYNQGDFAQPDMVVTVPQGKYFALGDNSYASLDSRFWGFVEEEDVVGKALFIWWPVPRAGMLE